MKKNNHSPKNKIELIYILKSFSFFSPYKKQVLVVVLCMLISLALSFIQPFVSEALIDEGIIARCFGTVCKMCGLLITIAVLTFCINLIKEKKRLSVYNNMRFDMEKDAFLHLSKIKMDYFRDKNISAIYQTLKEDISMISSIADADTFNSISSLVGALSGGIAIILLDWRLSLLVLIFVPLNATATLLIMKKNFPVSIKYISRSKDFNEWYGDAINGMKVIRLFTIQKQKENEIVEKVDKLKKLSKEQGFNIAMNMQIQSLIMRVFSISIYFVSGLILLKYDLTIGKVVAFETYAMMMTDPIIVGFSMLFGLSTIAPSIKRHLDFLKYPEEDESGSYNCVNGDLSFENVDFSYGNNSYVFRNVSFTIKQGSKVAVIGKNGSGKTTLLNLLLRIVDPTAGDITIDHVNINSYNINDYRKLFGVVSQDVYLFNASIRDNICLNREVSNDRLNYVIKIVNLKNLIDKKGYDCQVGENGGMLSGGQKQKIALARAIIEMKPIIILDEATSNLDVETIYAVGSLFDTELKNCTVICVSHTEEIIDLFENVIDISNL